MAQRRKKDETLERVVGVPGLFATAYGNVGSSIYYALGVVAAHALGLTPLVFVIAGLIFAMTAITYAEGTTTFPEAGGSSSFARHAFNETVAFGAAWAQMLNYTITIAISAFFVPHYLSVFWEPLKRGPWDVIVGIAVVALLALLNITGLKEAARLNVVLAILDLATQLFLVILGMVLLFSPSTLIDNVHLGVAPTWSEFVYGITVAMIAYTGIETVSNMAEEARDPARSIPGAVRATVVAVFVMYAGIPIVALSALPVTRDASGYHTELGTTFAADPILGIVDNFGFGGVLLSILKVYVGILAATILLIATNAGVIGVSRLTYSMGFYRHLPAAIRRVHPRLRTPYVSILIFCGIACLVLIPGKTDFLANMYAYGAMLSFTLAHAAIFTLRIRDPATPRPYRGRPNVTVRGRDVPVFAVLGGLGTGLAFIAVLVLHGDARIIGTAWMAVGMAIYVLYRRSQGLSLVDSSALARPSKGAEIEIAYTNILVPVVADEVSDDIMATAGKLAADQGTVIEAMTVIEVPINLPLSAQLPRQEAAADELLQRAKGIAEEYGARVVTQVLRARQAGRAIVDEATRIEAEVILMGVAPKRRIGERFFGRTVDFVLRNSPCRVIVSSDRPRAPAAAGPAAAGRVPTKGPAE
ncbi:MAG: basic amino acid/polyamine antiporter, family [Miltoncostaeaceae bacterium]|nr:basic amino acid/polyamine antiporter, family [Miltoncostaeaceae bacterium]